MPMPIDLRVEYVDGAFEDFYIPLEMMRGEKPTPESTKVLSDWSWANKSFSFGVAVDKSKIKSVTIDPIKKMADVDDSNNSLTLVKDDELKNKPKIKG